MVTILEKIVATKRTVIERDRLTIPLEAMEELAKNASPPRDFYRALAGHREMRLIAEVKKASPSKGILREDFDPCAIAAAYQSGGAAALSVLTDREYFQGDLKYLQLIHDSVDIPLLRKDFILDRYQVYQARAANADAILLIAECLDDETLNALYQLARSLGMHALIELYEPANLQRVLDTGCPIVGINNRDLRSFEVDLHHTIRMREKIPTDRCVVGESGIRNFDDVELLQKNNVQAILVGESLVRQQDICGAVKRLLGTA